MPGGCRPPGPAADLEQEAPHAYKGIGPIVDTLTRAGIARPVAELVPLMTIKG